MIILTVIPISRGIGKDTLTYFSKKNAPVGSIVTIPLRGKKTFGLVIESEKAEDIKSELKSLSYSIKKIENIDSHSFLSPNFIESAKKIADYNAGSLGATLSSLIPKTILEKSSELILDQKEKPSLIFHETLLLQTDDEERYATYKALIREEFAKSRSVFFCLPTTEDLLNAKHDLEKGIEKYTYILHSGLTPKEIVNSWKEIIEHEHPVLIIATGSFLSIPKNDLGTIILEKESSRAYKMQVRPFLDIRFVAETIAKESGIRLVLGDIFLRIETLWEEKNNNLTPFSPLKFRSLSPATCELLNTRTPQDMKKKEFLIISEKLKDLLLKSKENNEHTFLFCGRKGMYPITVCSDCGTVVVCKNCNAPVVLYGKPRESKTVTAKNNLFVCHHCGERRDAQELCVHCGGWRLSPLGIGIEKVIEEVKNLIKDSKVLIMDKDHVKNHKQAVKIRDDFYNTPGAVLVGTEMALSYLNQKIENSAIVSIDSYFSIPDFQINEKIFHIILSLRTISSQNMLIQTRQENTKIFEYALRGNFVDFYRDEIEDRKSIGYPPFNTFIKITLEGEKNTIKKQMEETAEFLKPYELSIFDAWNPGRDKKYTVHGLVSLKRGDWIDKNLLQKLKMLPPNFTVKIDPNTLL